MTKLTSGKVLNDTRDAPFLWLMLKLVLWLVPAIAVLYSPYYRWWMSGVYVVVTMAILFPPFTLMLHCTAHRQLFQKRFAFLNRVIPLALAPFFGNTPGSYTAHHIGMHHPENNLWKDESSTLPYQRDSAWGFFRYVTRFFVVGLPELTRYLWRARRERLVRSLLTGEVLYWTVVAFLFWLRPAPTFTVLIFPVFVARFAMMAGNWGQHAFVDASSPGNAYLNSITCIEVGYNERCFNDGYHIGHHLYPKMHFLDLPVEYEQNRSRYVQERALVFRGIDFVGVWALLMVGAYESLAKRIVTLDELSIEQRVALMKERLTPVLEPMEVTVGAQAA